MSSGPPNKQKTKAKTKKEKLASIAEWDAMAGRYPPGNRAALVQQIVLMLASNAFTVYLLVTHRMQPVHLVLLVAIEAVLLSLVAILQSTTVPPEAKPKSDQTVGQRIGALLFGLFWLAVVYSLVFAGFLRMDLPFGELLRHPRETLEQAGMLWPLGITLLAAIVDTTKDAEYFREHGGIFMSTPGFNAIARWLTLFLGGIPFFIPLVALGWVVSKAVERLNKRPGPASASGLALVVPLLSLGMFGVIGGLLSAGLSGWAIGYCSAKFASELLILCMPVIAVKAREGEVVEL
ncbi:MAG TPA: DUF6498-containing protein [Thermoanaerobaculia bacterium]|jgi:hypothetical protein|nr:DUF6498-containing protein [Thermoanaerobaculia bacterium]